jgi:hypothetical protein
VLGEIPVDQVIDRRRRALLVSLAHRVAALVDEPLEALGFLSCRRHLPVGKRADRVAPLDAAAAIVEDERAEAPLGHPQPEALHLVVVIDPVRPALIRRRSRFHKPVSQLLVFGHVRTRVRIVSEHKACSAVRLYTSDVTWMSTNVLID